MKIEGAEGGEGSKSGPVEKGRMSASILSEKRGRVGSGKKKKGKQPNKSRSELKRRGSLSHILGLGYTGRGRGGVSKKHSLG